MMSQKQGKLKDSMEELIGPLLKQLAKAPHDSQIIHEIRQLVQKMKDVLASMQDWDSDLIGYFGEIEREIDYQKDNPDSARKNEEENTLQESLEHACKKIEESSTRTRDVLMKNLTKLLDRSQAIDSRELETFEVGEPSNSTDNQKTDGSVQIDETYMNGLEPEKMKCLCSLVIFPENMELKRSLLVYWWIGLGLSEENAKRLYSDFVAKGILKQVHTKEHNEVIDRCTIHPGIRQTSNYKGKIEPVITNDANRESGTWALYIDDRPNVNVRALLNVDHNYLNSKDISRNILAVNKAMQVVQLGRWRCPTEVKVDEEIIYVGESQDHIEIDDTGFLKKLGEKVTFLSLRGISGIKGLPESIGKLKHLKILDLRACHNLENLPQKKKWFNLCQRKWFNNLTHLDISECYLLKYVPKWVCELSNLEVLKGFVAGRRGNNNQFCRLRDLSKLKKLRKLSIKIAKHLDSEDACSLKSLDWLLTLTVTWGITENGDEKAKNFEPGRGITENLDKKAEEVEPSRDINENDDKKAEEVGPARGINENDCKKAEEVKPSKVWKISVPENLKKLDIRCYPEAEATELLNPEVLPKLEKLYIRGGKLAKIANNNNWEVLKVVRLRFIESLEIDWYELRGIFNKLKHLEYKQCIGLKRFPVDRSYWNTEVDGPFPEADEGRRQVGPRRVKLTISTNYPAPLVQNTTKILLQLTGGDSISDRHGLDLVAILDVSGSMRGEKMKNLKIAMLYLINKLKPIDRLSVVTFSSNAKILINMSQMTQDSKREIEDLVENLEAKGYTNTFDGLNMGLKVLKDRTLSSGRACGIMLMSDGDQTIEYGDATTVDVGSVLVHTFGFGEGMDPKVLMHIAKKSTGGTFSDVRNVNNLTQAFSVCLAGLQTVVAQELTLTVMQIDKHSTLEKVAVRGYPVPNEDMVRGSVTIPFGDLYSKQDITVLVDVLLPSVANPLHAHILEVSYSYRFAGELFRSDNTTSVKVRRIEMLASQQQEEPEVIAEEVCQENAEMIQQAIELADDLKLVEAQIYINRAQKMLDKVLREKLNSSNTLVESLIAELQELKELMTAEDVYNTSGRSFAYALMSSHEKQRPTAKGDDIQKSLQYATPYALNFLEQAKKFDEDPSKPPPPDF